MFKIGDKVKTNLIQPQVECVITGTAEDNLHPGGTVYYLNGDNSECFWPAELELVDEDKPTLQETFDKVVETGKLIKIFNEDANTYIWKNCLFTGKKCPVDLKKRRVVEIKNTKHVIFVKIRKE